MKLTFEKEKKDKIMIPKHLIQIEKFQEVFENGQKVFGVINHTIVKAEQVSDPSNDKKITQYITQKELVCSIDVDKLLYNEVTEKTEPCCQFILYISGIRPGNVNFDETRHFTNFTDAYNNYNDNNTKGSEKVFYEGDDDVLIKDNIYVTDFGYFLIPNKKVFGFSEIIAYDRAKVISDGYSYTPLETTASTFDYRYKAIIMYVDFSYSETDNYQMRISFGLALTINGVKDKEGEESKLDPRGPEQSSRIEHLTEAIEQYNNINIHQYIINENEE